MDIETLGMHFSSFGEFLAMGGHAPYVWSSYAFMLVIVLWNVISALGQGRKVKQQISKRLAMQSHANESVMEKSL